MLILDHYLFKSILFNDRVRLNLGLFYSDYKDIQRSQLIAIGNDIATTVKNAASATVSGGELLLSLYLTPWLEFRSE